MPSIYQRALGTDFGRLHPQIQRRFGFGAEDRVRAVGSGVMDEIWHGAWYTMPLLALGTWRRIMFPESGRNVPFTIENYAFVDPYGRDTVSWVRTFQFARPRRFDAYMVYSQRRAGIVDYLGSHEHLAVDLELHVDERGGLRLRSGEQRFYEGIVGFPFPPALSGVADVCEWYDDATERFHIDVRVSNARWGPLFGYRGTFSVDWQPCTAVPAAILPRRYELRD